MTVNDIIKGCKDGKQKAQRALVDKYAGMLLTVSRRYARDLPEAEDILQDAFIKIFTYIYQFRSDAGSFEAWMRRIVVTTALRNFRKPHMKYEYAGLDQAPDRVVSPEAYANIGREELMAIISGLPNGYKEIFNLYVLEDFSHKEIAELLGITESTSRSQLTRARKILQSLIQKRYKIPA